jgi:hypothetical protein
MSVEQRPTNSTENTVGSSDQPSKISATVGQESAELWSQYQARKERVSVLRGLGGVVFWVIALTIILVGLWIVAVR